MSKWITRSFKGQECPRYRLFCFPFAGGTAATYRQWSDGLIPEVEVCSINLPGRGARFDEPAIDNMAELTRTLAEVLKDELTLPFFFFGHSMGAMVAFELTQKLRSLGLPLPQHLFLSGRPGPTRVPVYHQPESIPDEGLIAMLEALNGTGQNVLDNQEIVEFMLPSLRADMTLVQHHRYAPAVPLALPLTIFSGKSDPTLNQDELIQWQFQTSAAFRLHILEGDHFFLNHNRTNLLNLIAHSLSVHRDNDNHLTKEAPHDSK